MMLLLLLCRHHHRRDSRWVELEVGSVGLQDTLRDEYQRNGQILSHFFYWFKCKETTQTDQYSFLRGSIAGALTVLPHHWPLEYKATHKNFQMRYHTLLYQVAEEMFLVLCLEKLLSWNVWTLKVKDKAAHSGPAYALLNIFFYIYLVFTQYLVTFL